ncbi:MAG: TetR/AcrR family transcriptional regulator [Emcibacteraceae bacterium]|nr:TetR/AcrR family transcriptional regulator [Emcibacteraceae bacterium]
MSNLTNSAETEPKWRRRPEQRPDDILDGALKEFRERGFTAARIEDIAKHAGLTKGSVYLYFSSKEDMLKALVRRSVIPIAIALKNIADHICDDCSDETASDLLRKMLMIVGERINDAKTGSIPLLIIGEAGNFPELAAFYRGEVIEVTMNAVGTVIKRGVASGEFRDVNITYAIRSLVSVMIMQIVWNGVFVQKGEAIISMKDLLNSHLDIYLNGIVMPQEK